MRARFFAPFVAVLGLVALSALAEEPSEAPPTVSETTAVSDSADSDSATPAEESAAAPEAVSPDDESAPPVESDSPQQ